ncbi:Phosphoglycerate mutase [Rhodotorula kratochvilovae]
MSAHEVAAPTHSPSNAPAGSSVGTLILVRHGQSATNAANVFTGTDDPPLTPRGRDEASQLGVTLRALEGLPPITHAYTSPLQRASDSLALLLSSLGQSPPPATTVAPALNERDYGLLNGVDKDAAADKYGAEQVHAWRRGFRAVPPGGESLEMTVERVWAYYEAEVLPRLRRGECVLVVSHGNTLRGLCMRLDGLGEDEVDQLVLGTGALRVYMIDAEGKVVERRLFTVDGLEGGRQ